RGMGELHLEVVSRRLKDDFGVGVRLGQPNVVRKETITARATEWGVFERDNDEERIFGKVRVKVVPLDRDTGNVVVLDLPTDHPPFKEDVLDIVQQGVRDAITVGPSGEELVDVQATIVGLEADSSGAPPSLIGFRVAAGEALRNAVRAANPAM